MQKHKKWLLILPSYTYYALSSFFYVYIHFFPWMGFIFFLVGNWDWLWPTPHIIYTLSRIGSSIYIFVLKKNIYKNWCIDRQIISFRDLVITLWCRHYWDGKWGRSWKWYFDGRCWEGRELVDNRSGILVFNCKTSSYFAWKARCKLGSTLDPSELHSARLYRCRIIDERFTSLSTA